jgi:hypothetical protein
MISEEDARSHAATTTMESAMGCPDDSHIYDSVRDDSSSKDEATGFDLGEPDGGWHITRRLWR